MKLKEIMVDDVKIVCADACLKDVARFMKESKVGLCPVFDSNQLIGAISDRDITVRAVAEGRDPNTTKVREIMTDDVVYAFEDENIKEATALMKKKEIHRLLVFTREWQLTGIVSLADLSAKAHSRRRWSLFQKKQSGPAQRTTHFKIPSSKANINILERRRIS